MAKGDFVDVVYRTGGEGNVATDRVMATQNGRRVDTDFEKEGGVLWYVVRVLTRGGTEVHQSRFAVSEILAIRNAKVEKED